MSDNKVDKWKQIVSYLVMLIQLSNKSLYKGLLQDLGLIQYALDISDYIQLLT